MNNPDFHQLQRAFAELLIDYGHFSVDSLSNDDSLLIEDLRIMQAAVSKLSTAVLEARKNFGQ